MDSSQPQSYNNDASVYSNSNYVINSNEKRVKKLRKVTIQSDTMKIDSMMIEWYDILCDSLHGLSSENLPKILTLTNKCLYRYLCANSSWTILTKLKTFDMAIEWYDILSDSLQGLSLQNDLPKLLTRKNKCLYHYLGAYSSWTTLTKLKTFDLMIEWYDILCDSLQDLSSENMPKLWLIKTKCLYLFVRAYSSDTIMTKLKTFQPADITRRMLEFGPILSPIIVNRKDKKYMII